MANPQTIDASRLHAEPASARTARGPDMDVLQRIREPDVDLAIWERDLPGALRGWLENLPLEQLPCGRVLVKPNAVSGAIRELFEISGTPDAPEATAMVDDIGCLSSRFAAIAGCARVDIRLDVLQHDGCWKFHRDRVGYRLLSTYLGPSTQYVAKGDAERALGLQRDYNGALQTIPREDVALFKGSLDPNGGGVVHRSPPIAGTGKTRLLLCLNTPSAVSPQRWHAG